MIIREIKQQPELLETFDWFNDYKDTRRWVTRNCPELLSKMDEGYKLFLKKVNSVPAFCERMWGK